jgi:hypothetical protein
MKLRYKTLGVILVLASAAVLAAALVVSHTSPCGAAPPPPQGATLMKGAVRRCYGSPDVVHYEDIAKPSPGEHEVLVRVHAQYLVVPEDRAIALKLANVTFEQAATVAIAGITALQTLRDRGRLHAGLLS